jgi:ankyrin repeat protein
MVQDRKSKKYNLEYSTLLIETIKSGSLKSARYLIERGADVNVQNSQGVTPLMFAVAVNADVKFLKFLISHNADTRHKDMSGNTPLTGAVAMGRDKAVEVLLDAGADPDEASSKGYTPVMIAVMTNNERIFSMLMKAGADIYKPHPKGWTVFNLLNTQTAPGIRAVLEKMKPRQKAADKRRIEFPGGDITH